jgi:hypothetical protein
MDENEGRDYRLRNKSLYKKVAFTAIRNRQEFLVILVSDDKHGKCPDAG